MRCDMTGRNWGLLLQLAIFLPIQTILHPHNVEQPDVSPHPQHKRCQCTQPQQRHMQKKARTKFVLNSKTPYSPSLSICTGHASLDMASTSTTSFRLCTATRRYFLLRAGISVLPADEEDEQRVQVNGRAVCLSARCVLVCCCTAGTRALSHLAHTVLQTPVHGHTGSMGPTAPSILCVRCRTVCCCAPHCTVCAPPHCMRGQ